MKISNEHILGDYSAAQNTKSNTDGENFSDLLAEMVAEKVPQTIETQAVNPTETEPVAESPSLSPEWYKVNNLLDSLEAYGNALGDSSKTLKDSQPYIEEVESLAAELEQDLEKVQDPELAQLGQEVLLAARVETVKFWRGDYIV